MIQTPDGNWIVEVQGKQYVASCQRCARARQYSDVVTEGHWLVRWIKRPNPWQSDFEFREMDLSDLHRLMAAHDELHKQQNT